MLRLSTGFCCALACCCGLAPITACEQTREGVQQDARRLATTAQRGVGEAAEALTAEAEELKTRSRRALEELSGSLRELGNEAQGEVSESRERLAEELEEAKRSLEGLSIDTRAELEEAKRNLDAKLSELGKKIGKGVETAGDKAKEALD